MTVVQFPDEIIRRFLEQFDFARGFADYLRGLEYCATRELDPSLLHAWWRERSSELLSDHFEIDFVHMLNHIEVHQLTREQRRRNNEQRTAEQQATRAALENGGTQVCAGDTARQFITERLNRTARFLEQHPEYRCIKIAATFHETFESIYDETDNPLKVMARWLQQLLPCGTPAEANSNARPANEYVDGVSGIAHPAPEFVIGSAAHRHLVELADYVATKMENSALRRVLHWSLNNEEGSLVPKAILDDVRTCSHATFEHLVKHKRIEADGIEGFVCLLSLPLAVTASSTGAPHLLPEFGFLGSAADPGSESFDMMHTVGRRDLARAWRQFFIKYRRLRLRGNAGRGFGACGYLFGMALMHYAGDDFCWARESAPDCIAECIRDLQPDITCLLEFFLIHFGEDHSWTEEAETETASLREFPSKRLILPLVRSLRMESFHQLAGAILSFYLTLIALAAEGNLDELDGLDEALIESRRMPGFNCVEAALQFIGGVAEQLGHKLTQMKFEQFVVFDDHQVLELIAAGEGETIEFKSTLRTNLYTRDPDPKIEHAALKTIAGFLNKHGGTLLVGVDDEGEVIGTDSDGFANSDKLTLHLKNLLRSLVPSATDQINSRVIPVRGKEVLCVECARGDRPVYLHNRETKQYEFYVRRGPATDLLTLPEAVDYIQKEFANAPSSNDVI